MARIKVIVWRWVTTSRVAVRTECQVNGRRRSSGRVSGRRRDHSSNPSVTTPGNQNTARHGSACTRPAPTNGAAIGTSRNTAMISDISRAMESPSNRSRIMATLSDRGPAAPTPHRKRDSTTSGQLGDSAASAAAMA